jgi:hypothetical protein
LLGMRRRRFKHATISEFTCHILLARLNKL